jgi:hypothetical protein
VAHRFFHADQVDAAGDEHRAVAVPKVVPAEWAQTGCVAGALVPPAQCRGVEAPARLQKTRSSGYVKWRRSERRSSEIRTFFARLTGASFDAFLAAASAIAAEARGVVARLKRPPGVDLGLTAGKPT